MSTLTVGLLRRLSETPGAPGDEGAVRDLIAGVLHPLVDELSLDRMGNLIALKRGTGGSRLRVAATAHMDEVAFLVNAIDDDGFLHVLESGGVNPRTLLGSSVQVGPKQLPGVIGLRPIHFGGGDDDRTVPKTSDLVIDIGAGDQAAARAEVKIGQRAVFRTAFGFLGPAQAVADDAPLPGRGRVKGKAFDDRLGCLTLIGLLAAERQPFDFFGIFTVQEEIGLRGAYGAGHHLAPDVVLVLEGTVCDDLPGPLNADRPPPTTRLGHGPALTQRDRSAIAHPRLLQHLIRTAADHGLPYQFKQPAVGGTDAAGYGRHRPVPIAIVSTPCRYIHGPAAVAELSDLHNGLALLRAALPGIDGLFDQKETIT
ncbi:MAG: M20/M25/M40 family metallo-hydrolase [Caldilineales bacterium]|nr:M20/M25/M40 family metallo-hydrolase [Caldilineales bacterium]MCW5859726.1 M20/M25/M40 family metallo-hydrolase [Caldilineales bacterium]